MRTGSKGSTVLDRLADLAWLAARALRKTAFIALPIPLHFAIASLRFRLSGAQVSQNVRDNIQFTFGGDNNELLVESIVTDYSRFQQTSKVWRALVRHPSIDPNKRWPIEEESKKRLDNAVSEGSGVILATAHLGFASMIPRILRAHGYASKRVVAELPRRQEAKQRVDAWLAESKGWKRWLYEATEIYTAPQDPDDLVAGLDIRPVLAALARKEILMIACDGLRGTGFVCLELLGRPYPFPTGFMKIALLTGAQMLPTFAIPDEEGRRIRIQVGQPLSLDTTISIEENLRLFAAQLDAQLRRTPHLWSRWAIPNWFHQAMEWSEQVEKDPFVAMPPWMKHAGEDASVEL